MLAVLGAVGLQSGASQEAEEVEQKMKQHIESIMGDKLSRAKEQVEELQEAYKPEPTSKEGKPLKVYLLIFLLPMLLRKLTENMLFFACCGSCRCC